MKPKASTNGSIGPKRDLRILSDRDPLDQLREGIQEGREATKLLDYSEDFDEPTGRTEVNVRIEQPSRPEIELTTSGGDKPWTAALRFKAWPQVAALAILVAGGLVWAWLRR